MKETYKTYLKESSLSRVLTHINKTKEFGVMSPFRKEKSDKENESDYAELKTKVRELGYGFIELRGGYVGDEGFFPEKSLFIPNIKRKEIIEFGKDYIQHSVIHKNEKNFVLIGTNKQAGIGKELDGFDVGGKSISIDDIGDKFQDFFSKLAKGSHKGKKFLFKMQEIVETSMYYQKKHGTEWQTLMCDDVSDRKSLIGFSEWWSKHKRNQINLRMKHNEYI